MHIYMLCKPAKACASLGMCLYQNDAKRGTCISASHYLAAGKAVFVYLTCSRKSICSFPKLSELLSQSTTFELAQGHHASTKIAHAAAQFALPLNQSLRLAMHFC